MDVPWQACAGDGNFRRERLKMDARQTERFIDPVADVARETEPPFGDKHRDLPWSDGRDEEQVLLGRAFDLAVDRRGDFVRIVQQPDQYVRVEKEMHLGQLRKFCVQFSKGARSSITAGGDELRIAPPLIDFQATY